MQIQEATTKLQTAFKATNSAAGLSVGAVVDYAKQLSTTTTFSASATTAAAAALAKFQNIKGSTFTNTIKQAQNLSVVMGKDLTSSATELGAALQNPKQGWQQLAAAGVMFSDSQIEAIKNFQDAGQTAEAQNVILQALAEQYGNAAEAAGGTLGGKLDILHNSFSNIASVIGEAVEPAISAAVDQITNWLGSLDQNAIKAASWSFMAKAVGFVADAVQVLGIGWKAAQVYADAMLYGAIKAAAMLAKGIEASVNWLRKLAGMKELSLGAKSLDEFAEGMGSVLDEDISKLSKAWTAPDASKGVDQFFANAKSKNEEAMNNIAKKADETGKAIGSGLAKGMKQFTPEMLEAQKQIEDLQRQIKFFGMDERQKKIAEMQDKGLNDPEQIKKLQKLSHELRGKEITQEFETPLEKFQREMGKLKDTFAAGGISGETFERAKNKLTKDFQTALPETKASAGGALQRNSAEFRSALLNYQNATRNAKPEEALKRLAEEQVNQQEQSNYWLRLLAKAKPDIAALAGL